MARTKITSNNSTFNTLTRQYPYIWAWHARTGSMDYYIKSLCERAVAEKAPRNAIYRGDNGWHTLDEVKSADTVLMLKHAVELHFGLGAV